MGRILFTVYFVLGSSCFTDGQDHSNFSPETNPVFQLNYIYPTADKPQSKLWFMDECWWAILPDSTGPTLWQRTPKGWKEHPEATAKLKGVPGRADVWAENKQVTAVGVADSSLTVFRLLKAPGSPRVPWRSEVLAKLYPPLPSPIETATIAKDGIDYWWVAATAGSKVCVWFSADNGKNWTGPSILAKGIDEDDICTITPLKGGVGVIWSDQVRDAVLIREHRDGKPASAWEKETVIDSGNKTADDHLNTALSSDGTLWLVTKNSVDKAGQPQFVLRIRQTDGRWINRPYLVLESRMKRPSRPIVVVTEEDSFVFVGHGDNDRSVPYPYHSTITFALVDTTLATVWRNPQVVIAPDDTIKGMVQNATGPKFPFPVKGPWIILASDPEGRVYEADLKKLVQK
jgi:hypothetical protein